MKHQLYFWKILLPILVVTLFIVLAWGVQSIQSALAQHTNAIPPVAYAGLDQVVGQNITVTLDGSSSYDPDGDLPLSYLWSQTGGPAVTFTPTLSVTAFRAPTVPTVLTFTLAVTDSLGYADPSPDNVVIRVLGQPVANNDSGVGFTTDEKTAFLTGNVFNNDFDPAGLPLSLQSFDTSNTLGLVTLGNPSPGSLDTAGFGAPYGFVTTYFSGTDTSYAVVIQTDGKILAAGTAYNGINQDFALARFLPNGSLDTTFNSDGKTTTDFGGTDYGNTIVVQPNGKIIVAGYTLNGYDFALARYNIDGSLDATFGNLGKVTTDFGDVDYGWAAALQPDGKIIVAGSSVISSTFDFALARYNTNGSLDDTFGSGGKITADFNKSEDYVESVVIQTDGKIVVSGTTFGTTGNFAIARYNPDGSLDNTFGSEGKVITDFGYNEYASAIAIFNGKIIMVGNTFYNVHDYIAMARYEPNGNLDTTFGNDGLVITDFGVDMWVHGVALQPGSKIIVAGATTADGMCIDFAMARYNPDGNLDPTFGINGKVTTDFYGIDDCSYALALQPDGKIVAAGYAGNVGTQGSFALARYNSDSSTFNYDPKGQFNYLAVGEIATDTFSYMVADSVLTDTASVSITIIGVNDPPQFTSIPITTAINTIPYNYTIKATDPDTSDILTVTATTLPSWLTLVDHGDRTALLSGVPSAPGNYLVVLEITDGLTSATQVLTITVRAKIYLPTTIKQNAPPGS